MENNNALTYDNNISEEEKIQSINNIKSILSSNDNIKLDENSLVEIKDNLNKYFKDYKIICREVLFTLNTDKLLFGVQINPVISESLLFDILLNDNNKIIYEYDLELDSKLFELGLTIDEIVDIIIHDIKAITSVSTIESLRKLIDFYNIYSSIDINLRESANYSQLLIYGIKDTLSKLSSSIYNNDVYNGESPIADICREKISKLSYEENSYTENFPKAYILQWVFMIYRNMKLNISIAKDILKKARELTGSELVRREIDKTLASIDRIGMTVNTESCSIIKFMDKKNIPINEISIFKSLKTSGLRSIENDYYEYKILVKSAQDESEAMYALRGINTRINILADYINNTENLSPSEKKHWEDVIMLYQELRVDLTKKKIINKKQYGLFFDYSQLDNLDKNNDEY